MNSFGDPVHDSGNNPEICTVPDFEAGFLNVVSEKSDADYRQYIADKITELENNEGKDGSIFDMLNDDDDGEYNAEYMDSSNKKDKEPLILRSKTYQYVNFATPNDILRDAIPDEFIVDESNARIKGKDGGEIKRRFAADRMGRKPRILVRLKGEQKDLKEFKFKVELKLIKDGTEVTYDDDEKGRNADFFGEKLISDECAITGEMPYCIITDDMTLNAAGGNKYKIIITPTDDCMKRDYEKKAASKAESWYSGGIIETARYIWMLPVVVGEDKWKQKPNYTHEKCVEDTIKMYKEKIFIHINNTNKGLRMNYGDQTHKDEIPADMISADEMKPSTDDYYNERWPGGTDTIFGDNITFTECMNIDKESEDPSGNGNTRSTENQAHYAVLRNIFAKFLKNGVKNWSKYNGREDKTDDDWNDPDSIKHYTLVALMVRFFYNEGPPSEARVDIKKLGKKLISKNVPNFLVAPFSDGNKDCICKVTALAIDKNGSSAPDAQEYEIDKEHINATNGYGNEDKDLKADEYGTQKEPFRRQAEGRIGCDTFTVNSAGIADQYPELAGQDIKVLIKYKPMRFGGIAGIQFPSADHRGYIIFTTQQWWHTTTTITTTIGSQTKTTTTIGITTKTTTTTGDISSNTTGNKSTYTSYNQKTDAILGSELSYRNIKEGGITQTASHEIGHACRMVVKISEDVPSSLKLPNHNDALYYYERGPHCNYGEAYDPGTGNMKGGCVMYGGGGKADFCPDCLKTMRKMNLEKPFLIEY